MPQKMFYLKEKKTPKWGTMYIEVDTFEGGLGVGSGLVCP